MTRHEKSLQYALSVLTSERYRAYLDAIYLYGSCARGDQKYTSDVDLLLKLRKNVPADILRSMRVEATPDDWELPEVELKYFLGERFSQSEQFDRNLREEGKLLWVRA